MKRGKFSLSHYKLLTGDMGELLPIGLTEVLPGDTIQQATSALIRVSPLVAPVMHPVNVRIHHWFVPFRLIWEDFEKFITGGPDGMDASVFPTIDSGPGGFASGTLADYLGLPVGVQMEVSALPFRAYMKIWNEFYRDQDLQTERIVSLASGPDVDTNTGLRFVNWEKDYFTTSRPWTQKGAEVTIPLGVAADITGTGNLSIAGMDTQIRSAQGGGGANLVITEDGAAFMRSNAGGAQTIYPWKPAQNVPMADIAAGLQADLTGASSATINQLREAFALQRYAEARARYGSRYTEYLRYLGVRSSDARLERPEYLGGGKQTIQFSEVIQTGVTQSGVDAGVGELKGHGIGAMRSNRYRRFFEEHGYILSFISVLPKTMYAQGIPRTWSRRTKEDFFQRELQHIGQQEVPVKELYAGAADPELVFGYQDRYDEYRRSESSIAGDFRGNLDHWHMARIFSGEPVLNENFIASNPTKRIHAVQTEDVLWIMANHSIQARRMLSQSGAPI